MSNEKNTKITNEINDGKNDIITNDSANQVNEKLADKSKQNNEKNPRKDDENLSNKSDKENEYED